MDTAIIEFTQFSEYMRLKSLGYKTVWCGDGKICMEHNPAMDSAIDALNESYNAAWSSASEIVDK